MFGVEPATKNRRRMLSACLYLLWMALLIAFCTSVGAGPVEPKSDANDGLNGDNPYFQRYNVARAFCDSADCYWYTTADQQPGEPDPNGPQWVDYKPPLNILGPGRYRITAEYRQASTRADYDALYTVYHLGGTTTIPRSQREGVGYVSFELGEFDLEGTGWVRVQDPGEGSITFNKMKFTYLGPNVDDRQPSVPENVRTSAESLSSIKVSWSASTDNVAVAGYRIFRNGILAGTSVSPSYVNTGLQMNTVYEYTVLAYDAAGNESTVSSPPAPAVINASLDYCSVDLGSTDMPSMLMLATYTDGNTLGAFAGGLKCRQPMSANDKYYYCRIDDNYIYNGSTSMAYLEVCYFDEAGFIEPQYDSASDPYTVLGRMELTGTETWKTAVWTLTDCLFANRQNAAADFRLFVGPNSVKIDSVRVSRIPYSSLGSVSRDIGVNEIYRGLSHPQYEDGDTTPSIKDGIYCRRSFGSGDDYFYFNVSDAVIYDGSSPTVYLKVAYYDSPDGLIRPEYDSTSGAYTAADPLLFGGTNTWKEHVWTLHNVRFANRQNASSDFRLYVGTDQNVFIDEVVVSRVAFGDVIPPSVPGSVTAEVLSLSAVALNWTASTDNVGVEGYRVLRNGVQVGIAETTTYTDSTIPQQNVYSYTVSAFDVTGNESVQSSPPALAVVVEGVSISVARQLPNMAVVGVEGKTVTAVFDGFIYVEEPDRSSGIRVVPLEMPDGLRVGDSVNAVGTMGITNDGERCIGLAVVTMSQSE